jgi:hypothetical protein
VKKLEEKYLVELYAAQQGYDTCCSCIKCEYEEYEREKSMK